MHVFHYQWVTDDCVLHYNDTVRMHHVDDEVRRRSLRERDVSGHRSAGPQHVVPRGWDSGLKHTFSYFETSSIWSHGDGDMGTEEEGGRSRAHFECFWRRPSRERAATC